MRMLLSLSRGLIRQKENYPPTKLHSTEATGILARMLSLLVLLITPMTPIHCTQFKPMHQKVEAIRDLNRTIFRSLILILTMESLPPSNPLPHPPTAPKFSSPTAKPSQQQQLNPPPSPSQQTAATIPSPLLPSPAPPLN